MDGAVVDVIVPVYRGFALVRRCLDSVLSARQRTPFELIVIDDASDEPELTVWLDRQAARGALRLLRQPENRGFVAAVNAGMALHPERDAVLLNSDTEVANDWLDRLRAHARAPCVGTVTPFSNNATICSYPRLGAVNALPRALDLAALDRLAARVNAERAVELPTGVGFCLFVRRECWRAVGPFDAARFGLGYGEEVDFCLRAGAAGYRHLLAGDVFVYHQGEASFGDSAAARKARAQALIDAAYPDYPARIAAFVRDDPPRALRRRLDWARIAHAPRRLLWIAHGGGGGIDRHLEELAQLLEGAALPLVLTPQDSGARGAPPSRGSGQRLRWLAPDEEFELFLDLEHRPDEALKLLRALDCARVHYHQVAGLPQRILDLAHELGVPYDVTLHDYTVICPQHHLVTLDGRYCGEPDLRAAVADPATSGQSSAACADCLAERPPFWPLDIVAWRQRWRDWLASAARVIVPAHDVAARLRRYWPELDYNLWPHPRPQAYAWGTTPFTAGAFFKVLVLGGLSVSKGLVLVQACAQAARRDRLPLFFRILGPAEPVRHPWPAAPLSVAGSYREEQLPDLIALERPDGFFFPAQVPETFSYTLSAALHTGLPIFATALGVFPERLAKYPHATLLPPDTPPETWNAQFMAYLPAPTPARRLPARLVGQNPAVYRRRYLEPLRASAAAPPDPARAPPAFLPRQLWLAPERQPPEPTLTQLYSTAIVYRHGEYEDELARLVVRVEQALSAAEQERRALRRQLRETEAYYATRLEDDRAAALAFLRRERAACAAALAVAEQRGEALADQLRRAQAPRPPAWQRLAQAGKRRLRAWLGRAAETKIPTALPTAPPPVLRCARAARPLVSVVLAPTAPSPHLIACLTHLHAALADVPSETLLVGTDAHEFPPDTAVTGLVRIVCAEESTTLAQRANQALAQARGRYILWLAPEVALAPDAVRALLAAVRRPGVALVTPQLRWPFAPGEERLLAAGAMLWRDGSLWYDGRDDDPAKPAFAHARWILAVPAACWCAARARLRAVGGFAPDDDAPALLVAELALRLATTAHRPRCLYWPAAQACLLAAAESHPAAAQSALSPDQQALLVTRWPARLAQCPPRGARPEQARAPYVVRRVLIVAAAWHPAWVVEDAVPPPASQYSLALDDWRAVTPDILAALHRHGIETLTAPFFADPHAALSQRGPWLDCTILVGYESAARYWQAVRHAAPDTKLVYDAGVPAGCEPAPTDAAACRAWYRQQAAERALMQQCDDIWVATPAARAWVRAELPRARVLVYSVFAHQTR